MPGPFIRWHLDTVDKKVQITCQASVDASNKKHLMNTASSVKDAFKKLFKEHCIDPGDVIIHNNRYYLYSTRYDKTLN